VKRPTARHTGMGVAVAASAASPLLAQAGPALDADPLWLLIGGIVGPGFTLACGEVTRVGVVVVAAFTAKRASGGTIAESIEAAARAAALAQGVALPGALALREPIGHLETREPAREE